jgi:outer membrane receptor protein involved in Fe transport
MPRTAGWLAAWWLLLAATPAGAERPVALAYHGLRFLGLDAEQEAGLQHAVSRGLGESRRLRVVTARPELSESCMHDAACHCRAGRAEGAARVLFGNIGQIGHTFTFELVLVDTQSCATASSVFVSETHDAASARARLGALVGRLVTPREAVSTTVTKDERDVDAVPAIVTVITQQQIRQFGIQRFEELFRFVPGFEYLDANWGGIVLHQGLAGTILFLVDGVPLSTAEQNFLYYGRHFKFAIDHIDHVEFVRGPGSVLWGPQAFLGMINIVTRRPTEASPRVTARATYSTLNDLSLFASAEQRHRYFAYYVSASAGLAHGAQTQVENSPLNPLADQPVFGKSGATDNQLDQFYSIAMNLELLRRLTFVLHYSRNLEKFELGPYGALLSPETYGWWKTEHRVYALSWDDRLRLGFRYRLSASRYEFRSWENYVMHPPDARGDPAGLRYLQGNEVDPQVTHLAEARLYHSYQGQRWANNVLVGLAYRHQSLPNTYAMALPVTTEPGKFDIDLAAQTFHTVSGYLQEEVGLGRHVLLSGGVSLEHRIRPDYAETVPSAQGALIVRLPPYFGAKLIYAEGFRPPEANSLYSTLGVKGDPTLKAERSRQLSGELAGYLGPLTLRTGLTGAWLTDLVLIKWNHEAGMNCSDDPVISQCPVNAGTVKVLSYYVELRLALPPVLTAFANYSFKHLWESAPITNGADSGIAAAPHTASLGVNVRPYQDHLDLFATASLISARTVHANPWNPPENHNVIPTTFDFSLGGWWNNVFRGVDLGVTLHNPFGVVHYTPYDVDGNTARFIERRRVSEVLLTLRFSRAFDLGAQR